MRKLLITATAGLLSAGASWGVSYGDFNLLNPTDHPFSATTMTIGPGFATGGFPTRFLPGGTAFPGPSAEDGIDHAEDGAATGGATNGDFFAVFQVSSIVDAFDSRLFTFGFSPTSIIGIYYGANDDSYTFVPAAGGNPDHLVLQATGGHVEFWMMNPGTTVNSLLSLATPDLAGITAGNYANLTTAGLPLVRYDLITRTAGDNIGATDVRLINTESPNGPDFNNGTFFGNVAHGFSPLEGLFDTNNIDNTDDGIFGADLSVDYVMNALVPNGSTLTTVNDRITAGNFPLNFTATALGGLRAVPEPSTLLLMGTGLLGMVGYVRRRKNA